MSGTYDAFTVVAMLPQQTVGTVRAVVTVPGRRIIFQADPGNSGTLYIGDVTVTSAAGGNVMMALQAGAIFELPLNNANYLNIVGSAAGQKYYVSGLS